jgi:RNA polymerase sigma-70 factor (ECF subfamily)
VTGDALTRARAGDEQAFQELVAPYRRELQVHCYRFLGSLHDAEDVLQETMLAAWQGLGGFEARASVRTWLYRVATNRCLNALRSRRRRRVDATVALPDVQPPEPTSLGDVTWLEPIPDVLLDDLPDTQPGPDARYESREAISLAFVVALQHLPPRQRAVLILRDVLGYTARQAAEMLDATEQSVTSALKRARATLRAHPFEADSPPPPDVERAVMTQLTRAYERGDIDALVALLTDDVWLRMPPLPLEYQGRELAGAFQAVVAFRNGRQWRMLPTRANGQPALAAYIRDPHGGVWHANGLVVFTLRGDLVSEIIRFDNSVLDRFGFPRTLSD